jgi:hypothetical protein
MFKGVEVVSVKTMADGTIRLTIDVQDGVGDDIKAAYALKFAETSMLLAPTESFVEAMQEVVANFRG